MDDGKDEPNNPLPPEVQAMEEEFQKLKAEREAITGVASPNPFGDIGLGYTTTVSQA